MPSQTKLVLFGLGGLFILGLIARSAHLSDDADDGTLHVINGKPEVGQPYEVAYQGNHYSLVCQERSELKAITGGFPRNSKGPCDLSQADGLKVFGHDNESEEDLTIEMLEANKRTEEFKNYAGYDHKNKQFVVAIFHNRKTMKMAEIIYTFNIIGTK
jgi:hypothetical protein